MHQARSTLAAAVLVGAGIFTATASADVKGWDFEPGGFAPGNVNGQQGWTKTGATVDATVVSNAGANLAAFGYQSLRLANGNAPTGGFSDQAITPSLVDGAGESGSDTKGFAGGVRQPTLDTSFKFRSQDGVYQPGLRFTASPEGGAGSRNGFVAIEDRPAGLAVVFTDVPSPVTAAGHVDFVSHDVATGLSRTSTHSVRTLTKFVDGANNDVVQVYVDGVLVATGTTWENYYRNDVEQGPSGNTVPVVDELIFRMNSQSTGPLLATQGLLVDDVRLESYGGPSGPVGPTGAGGATGAAGVPGPVGPAGQTKVLAQSAFGGVLLSNLRVRRSSLRYTVTCPASAGLCDGTVSVATARRLSLGTRRFVLGGGSSTTVTLRLGPTARKRLAAAGGSVSFRGFARDRTGFGAITTKKVATRR